MISIAEVCVLKLLVGVSVCVCVSKLRRDDVDKNPFA